jgi:DNA replication protein DnaC
MTSTDELVPVLKHLKLSGLLHTLPLRVRQAVEDGLDHHEFLFRLLHDELERRDTKRLKVRLDRANFEAGKTLEDFDFLFNVRIPKPKVIDLATCRFVERHEAVMLVGPTGVGKSHLAQAIGHRAVRKGHDVLFVTANQLFSQLRAGRGDGTYEKRLAKLGNVELLIVDDVGLRALRGDEPEDLHELVRMRYERGAWVFTSNRAMDEWPDMFGDPLLASASLDRLLHNAHIIEIEGDSYRTARRPR